MESTLSEEIDAPHIPRSALAVALLPSATDSRFRKDGPSEGPRLAAFLYEDVRGEKGGLLREPAILEASKAHDGFQVFVRDLEAGNVILEIFLYGEVPEGKEGVRRIVLARATRRLEIKSGRDILVTFKESDLSPEGFDYDGDGLTNLGEILEGTSPVLIDTDSDRVPDGVDGFPLTRTIGRLRP